MSLRFFIPDTSPLLIYSPCVDCTSGSSEGNWISGYSPRGDGFDQTFHQAIGGTSSTVQLNLTANSISVRTDKIGSDCGLRYRIDDGEYIDGCSIQYPAGHHTLSLSPQESTNTVQLLGIEGFSSSGPDGTFQNSTVDSSSSAFSYDNAWTVMEQTGAVGSASNLTVANQYSALGLEAFYNHTALITTASGGELTLNFKGTGVYLYGLSGPDGGSAEVSLDGVMMNRLNMTSHWRAYSSLLFFATDLDDVQHDLKIKNVIGGQQIAVDYAQVTIRSDDKKGPDLPLIIGVISGVSAVLLIVAVLLYLYHTRKQTKPKRLGHDYEFAQGFSYRDLSPAKATSIDSWRKKAAGSSVQTTPSTASASSDYAGRALGWHAQPRAARPDIGPVRSPPPEYPDYLPYRGPIEPPSNNTGPVTSTDVPDIIGLDASTDGWLNQVSRSRSLDTSNDATTVRRNQDVHRPDPIPLRDRYSQYSGAEEIPLDSYYSNQDYLSPVSTISSLGFSSMTTRAIGATRSVARLWPPSITMTTTPETSVQHVASTEGMAALHSVGHRHTGSPSAGSTSYPPLPSTASSSAATQLPRTAGMRSDDAVASDHDMAYRSSSIQSPSSAPLRRGVSIKSVKTMRSFFSGLLGSSTSSALPATPALPAPYAQTFMIHTPARPDSDIFPQASISRNNSSVRPPSRIAPFITTAHTDNHPETLDRRDNELEISRVSTGSTIIRHVPPMPRLDTAGENMFIELNPDSPVTRIGESRPGSQSTSLTGKWRNNKFGHL